MATVHDYAGRADLGGGVQVLLQELAARDPNPVIGGCHVQHVRRVNVERDAGLLGCRLEARGAAGVDDLRAFPRLRVAEKELRQCRSPRSRLGDRIDLVPVPTYLKGHEFDPPP